MLFFLHTTSFEPLDSSYYCSSLLKLEKGQVTNSCDTSNHNKGSKSMKKYRHLTFWDRIYRVKYISECLGVNPTTISRELKRGRTTKAAVWDFERGYRPDLGERHKVLCGRV